MPVIAKLKNLEDVELVEASQETFTITTQSPVVTKYAKFTIGWRSLNNTQNQGVDGGKESEINEGFLTDDLNELNSVEFSFSIANSPNTTNGKRYYDRLEISDTLPEGAVFIPEDNPGWTFDETTRIASYSYIDSSSSGFLLSLRNFYSGSNLIVLKLKFPNQEINKILTNEIEVEAFPKNKPDYEASYTSSDTITFKLKVTEETPPPSTFKHYKSVNPSKYYDYQVDRNKTQEWTLRVTNSANPSTHADLNLENVKVLDRNLDSALMYTGLQFSTSEAPEGPVNVIVTYNDDSSEIVASNLDVSNGQVLTFTNSEEIKTILVEFSDKTYLAPESIFSFKVRTELKDKDTNVLTETESYRHLYNSADFSGKSTNGTSHSGSSSVYFSFYEIVPSVSLYKNLLSPKQNYFINDEVTYNLGVSAHSFVGSVHEAKINKIVDILPDGLEYIDGSASLRVPTSTEISTEMQRGTSLYEPEVIFNYMGTGHTALIWEFKPFSFTDTTYRSRYNGVYNISYRTKITEITKQGVNRNTAYLSWLNTDEISPFNSAIDDQFDLNDNQVTTDKITHAVARINYVPPRELIVRKAVKGSLNTNFILPPSTGLSEIGTEMTYQFSLFNNSIMDVTTLHVLDLLPIEGDKTVSEDITLEISNRIDRGSTFPLKLSGPIFSPTGYKIMYTLDDSSTYDDIKEFYRSAQWFETVDDYSQVSAVRIELVEGHVLASGEEQIFNVTFNTPNNPDLTNEDKAVNSFGIAISDELDFFESNLSTVKLVKYEVDGYVFKDINTDGIFTNEDDVFEEHVVLLEDAQGNPVLDLNGNPIHAMTNDEGNYHFDVFREGNYRVRIVTPRNYEKIETSNPSVENESHILQGDDLYHTDTFSLNRNNLKETRNGGYVQVAKDVTVTKTWVNGPTEYPDITVQLYRNNEVYGDTITISYPETEYTWLGLSLYDSQGNLYEYTVDEVNTPENYEKVVDGTTITNTYQSPKIEVTVNKVWVDGPSDYPVIEVQLYRDGEAYGNPIELDGHEQNPWSYTWTGLAATDINGIEYVYSIDELTVPEGYTKHIDGLTITNIFDNPEEPEIPEEPGVELPETGTSYPWHQSAAMLLIGGGLLLLLVKRKRNNG